MSTQAKILHGLIKNKKLKCATKLLGFKDVRNKNACENIIENVTTTLYTFGKSRKTNISVARRELQLLLWHKVPQEIEWSQQCQRCSMFQEKHCTNTLNSG